MIAVGIPTHNEVDNIANLVQQIDTASVIHNTPIVIINSDNNSPDGTAKAFGSASTVNPKVSLITTKNGKGRNIFAIFEEVMKDTRIEYCLLIDGDLKSFEDSWLVLHHEQKLLGADYVLPNYRRKYIEGNATNHFAYPAMRYLLNGAAPRQPLAGDIGISRKLIKHILEQSRPESAYGYGIDMFISVHAAAYRGLITQIDMGEKIHNPSFSKMIEIFQQASACYFAVRELNLLTKAHFNSSEGVLELLDAESIPGHALEARLEEARALFRKQNYMFAEGSVFFDNGQLSQADWAKILLLHEGKIGEMDAERLAMSLTPYYLLRVVTYLKENDNAKEASREIQHQALEIQRTLSRQTN